MKTGSNVFKISPLCGITQWSIRNLFCHCKQTEKLAKAKEIPVVSRSTWIIYNTFVVQSHVLPSFYNSRDCQFFTFCFLKLMTRNVKMAKFLQNRQTEWMFMGCTILANFSSNSSGRNQFGGLDDFDQTFCHLRLMYEFLDISRFFMLLISK